MNNRTIDNAHKAAKGMFDGVIKQMEKIQSAPIGKELRSKRELSGMIVALQNMPPDERQSKMEEMARIMGHEGPKMDDCGLCSFLWENVKQGG